MAFPTPTPSPPPVSRAGSCAGSESTFSSFIPTPSFPPLIYFPPGLQSGPSRPSVGLAPRSVPEYPYPQDTLFPPSAFFTTATTNNPTRPSTPDSWTGLVSPELSRVSSPSLSGDVAYPYIFPPPSVSPGSSVCSGENEIWPASFSTSSFGFRSNSPALSDLDFPTSSDLDFHVPSDLDFSTLLDAEFPAFETEIVGQPTWANNLEPSFEPVIKQEKTDEDVDNGMLWRLDVDSEKIPEIYFPSEIPITGSAPVAAPTPKSMKKIPRASLNEPRKGKQRRERKSRTRNPTLMLVSRAGLPAVKCKDEPDTSTDSDQDDDSYDSCDNTDDEDLNQPRPGYSSPWGKTGNAKNRPRGRKSGGEKLQTETVTIEGIDVTYDLQQIGGRWVCPLKDRDHPDRDCPRNYNRVEHVRRHMRTHDRTKKYICPVMSCKGAFNRHDNLCDHFKTHLNPSPAARNVRMKFHQFYDQLRPGCSVAYFNGIVKKLETWKLKKKIKLAA